jgi:tetratricopeptide (TPR) repeat protein
MKTINIFIGRTVIFPFLFAFLSCESFLTLTPDNAVPDGNPTISSAGTLRAAIIGAYNELQGYSGNLTTLATASGDNAVANGSVSSYFQLNQHAVPTDHSIVVSTYRSIYRAVNITNTIIASVRAISDPQLSDAERNQILGEAYFLRALGYFDLVRGWGGVQVQTLPTDNLEVIKGIRRSSPEETYNQALADLVEAEKLLPDDAATRNRAQKSTAKALRARLYLYREQWDDAERYASEVIASDKYELVKPYKSFFTAPYLSKESVFELTHSQNDKNGYWSTWLPSALGGSHSLKPSDGIVEKLNNPAIGGSRSALIDGTGYTLHAALYNNTAGTGPLYVIRIAELYLIRAEARAKKAAPDLAGAVEDLNAVRERADVPRWEDLADRGKIIEAIEEENNVEFAFEAHRWFDLVRTKRAGEVLGVTNTNFWLYPIPQSDIFSDPDAEKNPGY